eukprot:365967-Chlamydomonas_euryale.AAC.3
MLTRTSRLRCHADTHDTAAVPHSDGGAKSATITPSHVHTCANLNPQPRVQPRQSHMQTLLPNATSLSSPSPLPM